MSFTERVKRNDPLRILTADTLITDYIVKDEVIPELVASYHQQGKLLPDSKMQISRKQYDELMQATQGRYETKAPGGSSFNTSLTLRRALGDKVAVSFMGVLGEDEDSRRILRELQKAEIKLVPLSANHDQFAPMPEAATSFVVMYQDRRRAVASYPGTSKSYLLPEMVTEKRVNDADVVFLQGSLWQKLDETFPVHNGHAEEHALGFADKLMKYRWSLGKELWFALPTQQNYGTIKRSHHDKAAHFRHVMAESNVILGNSEELARAYTYDNEYEDIARIIKERGITAADLKQDDANPDPIARLVEQEKLTADEVRRYDFMNHSVQAQTAFERLQQTLAKEPLLAASKDDKHHGGAWKGSTNQVAFITCGKQGSVVITKDGTQHFPAAVIHKDEIKNTVGAGDTAFAGFLTGYIHKEPYADCAKMASELACAKLRHNGATLPDPKAVFRQYFSEFAGKLDAEGRSAAQAAGV
ncbi:MAG: carbohydrate kinase family protein [Rickettsiales bacterium]|jgi:sugar/nucleoside kinase (ribokinase family)|nr:carbohydrate kinase family protein [Rickettsiales bacterium]